MKTNQLLLITAILLILIGLAMIIIGIRAGILPPPLTGIGFILIALVFLQLKK